LTEALRGKYFAVIFDWFSMCFLVGATAFLLLTLIAACASKSYDGIRITAFAAIFAGASTVCGWILGLLFGIPRTLSRPALLATQQSGDGKSGAAPATSTSRVNTNLEDVSDWLTKTLVGVGLTQLNLAPHYLWTSAQKINAAGFGWDNYGQVLALALFLYFAPGGFWLGYIGTRTILTKLFDSLEGPTPLQVDVALSKDALKLDVSGDAIAPASSPEIAAADFALLSMPITSLNSPRELGAWGAAKARSADYNIAAFALEQATRGDPSDTDLVDALGKIYLVLKKRPEATKVLQTSPPSEATVLAALYEDTQVGVERALQAGSYLAKQSGADENMNLHVWMACAYGQQRKHALKDEDQKLADTARENAIKEIRTALGIDADKARPWLRSLWLPERGSVDDDLSSISAEDEELRKLLGKKR